MGDSNWHCVKCMYELWIYMLISKFSFHFNAIMFKIFSIANMEKSSELFQAPEQTSSLIPVVFILKLGLEFLGISLAKRENFISPYTLFIFTIFFSSAHCWIAIIAGILSYSWRLIVWNDVCNWFSINRYFHIQEVSLDLYLLEDLLKMAIEFYWMFFRTYWCNPFTFPPCICCYREWCQWICWCGNLIIGNIHFIYFCIYLLIFYLEFLQIFIGGIAL